MMHSYSCENTAHDPRHSRMLIKVASIVTVGALLLRPISGTAEADVVPITSKLLYGREPGGRFQMQWKRAETPNLPTCAVYFYSRAESRIDDVNEYDIRQHYVVRLEFDPSWDRIPDHDVIRELFESCRDMRMEYSFGLEGDSRVMDLWLGPDSGTAWDPERKRSDVRASDVDCVLNQLQHIACSRGAEPPRRCVSRFERNTIDMRAANDYKFMVEIRA